MVYNQARAFAGARLREAARECGVRKKVSPGAMSG